MSVDTKRRPDLDWTLGAVRICIAALVNLQEECVRVYRAECVTRYEIWRSVRVLVESKRVKIESQHKSNDHKTEARVQVYKSHQNETGCVMAERLRKQTRRSF